MISEEDTLAPKKARKTSFPTFLDILVAAILFILAQTATAAAISYFGIGSFDPAVTTGDVEADIQRDIALGNRTAVLYPISMVLAIILIIGYMQIRRFKRMRVRFSPRGCDPTIILHGFFWLLASMVLIEPLAELLPEIDGNIGSGKWACFTAVVAAPILEETLFRGVLLEAFRTKYNDLVAVIVSAFLFGVMHISPSTVVTAFISGIVLGTIYLRTSSIFSSIILHSINNAIAYFLLSVGAKDITFRELCGNTTVYLILIALSLFFFLLMCKYSWNTVFKPNFEQKGKEKICN